MTRYMLMRQAGADAQLIPETPLPLEKDLHDVLTLHPELLPAEDLGLGRVVVAGRESSLTSGYADLVLVDERGQLCLVEVKKAGNPDTRQVVAQLLDYAAALWGQSIAEFEAGVVAPYLVSLGHEAPGTLLDHLSAVFDDELEGSEDRARSALDRLDQTLAAGDFTLVVAAPDIPLGVQRVLEYLNARGQRFFALEVSYFKGPTECFVPRLVVMPSAKTASSGSTTAAMEPEVFVASLPAHVRGPVQNFITASASIRSDLPRPRASRRDAAVNELCTRSTRSPRSIRNRSNEPDTCRQSSSAHTRSGPRSRARSNAVELFAPDWTVCSPISSPVDVHTAAIVCDRL